VIKSVNNYPVSQLFDIDSHVVYAVPRYQREYTWAKNQWEPLFDDILNNEPGYFLGSIICINQSEDALAVQRLEVVDGQQRLTSLSLLFAALYQFVKEAEGELSEDQRVEIVNLKRKLVLKTSGESIRVVPQIQNNNNSDYRAVLADIGVIQPYDFPPYAGNRKILRAFRYFQSRVQQLGENGTNHPSQVLDYLDRVSRACLVKIEVANHADAYTLFESLNNRGVPLTAVDLIKNKLLARLEKINPGNIDQYFGQWTDLLGYLGDDYGIQERFFRHFYNASKEELNAPFRKEGTKGEPLGSIATRSNIIEIYERLIEHDARTYLQELRSAGKLYGLLLDSSPDKRWEGLEPPLRNLERIQGAASYLLMLHLLRNQEKLKLNISLLSQIASTLVCFFVRRNLTDTPPTRDLDRLFMAVIDNIAIVTGGAVLSTIRRVLLSVSASDEEFRNRLGGPIYDENYGVTRFILCALAEKGMTKETWVDLWRVENKLFFWTVEHIFPQGDNIPNSWIRMMANGDREKAKALQESLVHTLGNLTITAFNSVLGNKAFEEKRDRKDRKGRLVGYKNGICVNKELAKASHWSAKQIEDRTRNLVDQTLELFPL
jgi:hypothetical protein